MRHDPLFVVCDVHWSSIEEGARIQELVCQATRLDAVMSVTVITSGAVSEVAHRVGDYFEEIRIFPEWEGKPCTLRLVFHRRPDAGRFWKDLLVRILRSIEEPGRDVSVTMVYKGNVYPEEARSI